MEKESIIGVSVAIAAVLIVGIHGWLHRLLKFKMDESAILKFFADSDGDCDIRSTDAISSGADISVERVAMVCDKSKAIVKSTKEKESWSLK